MSQPKCELCGRAIFTGTYYLDDMKVCYFCYEHAVDMDGGKVLNEDSEDANVD